MAAPGRTSKMFRVTWRDMSRTLTNEEVNAKHEKVLERSLADGDVEIICKYMGVSWVIGIPPVIIHIIMGFFMK